MGAGLLAALALFLLRLVTARNLDSKFVILSQTRILVQGPGKYTENLQAPTEKSPCTASRCPSEANLTALDTSVLPLAYLVTSAGPEDVQHFPSK